MDVISREEEKRVGKETGSDAPGGTEVIKGGNLITGLPNEDSTSVTVAVKRAEPSASPLTRRRISPLPVCVAPDCAADCVAVPCGCTH